jgi:hypothetical protein
MSSISIHNKGTRRVGRWRCREDRLDLTETGVDNCLPATEAGDGEAPVQHRRRGREAHGGCVRGVPAITNEDEIGSRHSGGEEDEKTGKRNFYHLSSCRVPFILEKAVLAILHGFRERKRERRPATIIKRTLRIEFITVFS